ncbi:MAG: NifU family protein [Proteobacteria bacterium]|nr:NifU family protein [Pseudomonadota bacterium]
MFIQTEPTPDPRTLRFLPGRAVLGEDSVSFADAEAAQGSPLAARLFQMTGVNGVTLGQDFIAVTKTDDADWQLLKPAIFGIIMEHFLADRPVLAGGDGGGDAVLIAEIEELIETRIRPGIVREGGDIAFRELRGDVVVIELSDGGYKTPVFSLKVRVENTLRHYVPEVASVEFVRAGTAGAATSPNLDPDDPEVASIKALLDERINPGVEAHGGYISLIDVKDHTAFIRLEGGCQGCGMADVTLKQGIERMILEEVPTITAVLDSTDHASGTNPYYEAGKSGLNPF